MFALVNVFADLSAEWSVKADTIFGLARLIAEGEDTGEEAQEGWLF